jgi:uncharacterized protein (DUF1015 family)
MEDTILSKKLNRFLNKEIKELTEVREAFDGDGADNTVWAIDREIATVKKIRKALRQGDFDDLQNMSDYARERRKAKRGKKK